MSYPRYEIFKDTKKEYRFRLLDKYKDNILAASEGYTTKANCENAIAICQENSPYDKNYARRTTVSNKYYFTLRSDNGRDIGISKDYDTATNRDAGIEVVKRDGPTKTVVDLT